MNDPVRIRRIAALGVAASLVALAPWTEGAGEVAVELALSQQFYYEGDPLDVRVSVQNLGDKKIDNPIASPLVDGFRVRSRGEPLERTGKTTVEEPVRPSRLAADSFYGAVVNLVDLYPRLGTRGTYEIYWQGHGILSEMLVVTIIPRYDPGKSYVGEIETELGSIVIDLMGADSPVAVKSFVDLAHAGFYDGLQISEVRADDYIVGGDPRSGSAPRQPIQFPAEQSALPLVAGTVVLKPMRATPPANGPTFVIMLRPQTAWTGQVTVLGQVVEGLDVVQRISRLPSSMRNSEPNFKPLRDVTIKKLTIREKAAAGAPF